MLNIKEIKSRTIIIVVILATIFLIGINIVFGVVEETNTYKIECTPEIVPITSQGYHQTCTYKLKTGTYTGDVAFCFDTTITKAKVIYNNNIEITNMFQYKKYNMEKGDCYYVENATWTTGETKTLDIYYTPTNWKANPKWDTYFGDISTNTIDLKLDPLYNTTRYEIGTNISTSYYWANNLEKFYQNISYYGTDIIQSNNLRLYRNNITTETTYTTNTTKQNATTTTGASTLYQTSTCGDTIRALKDIQITALDYILPTAQNATLKNQENEVIRIITGFTAGTNTLNLSNYPINLTGNRNYTICFPNGYRWDYVDTVTDSTDIDITGPTASAGDMEFSIFKYQTTQLITGNKKNTGNITSAQINLTTYVNTYRINATYTGSAWINITFNGTAWQYVNLSNTTWQTPPGNTLGNHIMQYKITLENNATTIQNLTIEFNNTIIGITVNTTIKTLNATLNHTITIDGPESTNIYTTTNRTDIMTTTMGYNEITITSPGHNTCTYIDQLYTADTILTPCELYTTTVTYKNLGTGANITPTCTWNNTIQNTNQQYYDNQQTVKAVSCTLTGYNNMSWTLTGSSLENLTQYMTTTSLTFTFINGTGTSANTSGYIAWQNNLDGTGGGGQTFTNTNTVTVPGNIGLGWVSVVYNNAQQLYEYYNDAQSSINQTLYVQTPNYQQTMQVWDGTEYVQSVIEVAQLSNTTFRNIYRVLTDKQGIAYVPVTNGNAYLITATPFNTTEFSSTTILKYIKDITYTTSAQALLITVPRTANSTGINITYNNTCSYMINEPTQCLIYATSINALTNATYEVIDYADNTITNTTSGETYTPSIIITVNSSRGIILWHNGSILNVWQINYNNTIRTPYINTSTVNTTISTVTDEIIIGPQPSDASWITSSKTTIIFFVILALIFSAIFAALIEEIFTGFGIRAGIAFMITLCGIIFPIFYGIGILYGIWQIYDFSKT